MAIAKEPWHLGQLEKSIFDVLRGRPEATVHDVLGRLNEDLPYTTVLSGLDRLYRRGMLSRAPRGKSFVYKAVPFCERVKLHIKLYLEHSAASGNRGDALCSSLVEAL